MSRSGSNGISRREFARRVAVASAATLVPATALPSETGPVLVSQQAGAPQLSSAQAEADTRVQMILNLYGPRLSDTQKADLRRLCLEGQPALDRVRAFRLESDDQPAVYLKPLVEREKKPSVSPNARPSTGSRRQP